MYGGSYGNSYGSSYDDIIELLSGGMMCFYLIALIASAVFIIWGAQMAQDKGKSAGKWVALIYFFGLIPFIVLCCLPSEQRPLHSPKQPFYTQQNNGASAAPQRMVPTTPPQPTTTRVVETRKNPDGTTTRVTRTITRKPKESGQQEDPTAQSSAGTEGKL